MMTLTEIIQAANLALHEGRIAEAERWMEILLECSRLDDDNTKIRHELPQS